jgi:oxidase EvaA
LATGGRRQHLQYDRTVLSHRGCQGPKRARPEGNLRLGSTNLTQSEGGVLALLCRETPAKGVEFLLQAKADPGNVGYLQLCPTIQSTWENIRGLKGAKRAPFAEYLDPSENIRVIYRSKHNEEGSRFWQKSNENMILFVEDTSHLTFDQSTYRWASLSQIKQMMLLDNVVGPYVRTVVAPL